MPVDIDTDHPGRIEAAKLAAESALAEWEQFTTWLDERKISRRLSSRPTTSPWESVAEMTEANPCPHCGQFTLAPVRLKGIWRAFCAQCHEFVELKSSSL